MKNPKREQHGGDYPLSGDRVGFKFYVEGVPMRFIAGNVSAGVNTPAVASVTIPFSPLATHIRPRSIATITFWLNHEENEYVLFDGEIVGYSVSGNAESKAVVFNLASPLSFLSRIKRYGSYGIESLFKTSSMLFMNANTKLNLNLGVKIQNLSQGMTPIGDLIAKDLRDPLARYPDMIIEATRQQLLSTTFTFPSPEGIAISKTPYQVHHELFEYMNQFSLPIGLDQVNTLFKEYLRTLPVQELVNSKLGAGLIDSGDLWSGMNMFLNQFFMNIVDLGVPFKQENIEIGNLYEMYRSVVFPSHNFLLPPACNVITADSIVQSNIGANFLLGPTRFALSLGSVVVPGVDQLDSRVRGAPTHQFGWLKQERLETDLGSYVEQAMCNDLSFSNNELFLGIQSSSLTLPEYYVSHENLDNLKNRVLKLVGKPSEDIPGLNDQLFTKMADHLFLDQKFSSRGAQILCNFSPNLIPGFSTFVADPELPYFAYIQSVTHAFSANGASSTQVMCSHVTQFMDYLMPTLRYSHAIDDKLQPLKIGQVYRDMGLKGSMADLVASSIDGGKEPISGLENGDHSVTSYTLRDIQKSYVATLRKAGFYDEANSLDATSPERIAQACLSKDSIVAEAPDEGMIKIFLAEVILHAIRNGSFGKSAVTRLSRDLVDLDVQNIPQSFSYFRTKWLYPAVAAGATTRDTEEQNKDLFLKQYGVNRNSKEYAVLQTRTDAARALADDLLQENQGTKTKPNIGHSIFGLFSDDIIKKHPDETKWREDR